MYLYSGQSASTKAVKRPVSVVFAHNRQPQAALPSHARDLETTTAQSQHSHKATRRANNNSHGCQGQRRPVSLIAITTSVGCGIGGVGDAGLFPSPRGSPPPVYSPRM